MDQIEIVHTRVFAAGPDGGNPCPVIPDADLLRTDTMQALARRFRLDTVFILKPEMESANIRLRYFVPDHEMGVSGHATIAAIAVAVAQQRLTSGHGKVETSSGLFEFACAKNDGRNVVTFEQNSPVFGRTISPDRIAQVLKIGIDDVASNESPIQAVSVSRPKLIVPIRDWETLDRLEPDFEALWRLCDTEQVSGIYAFTRHTNKENAVAEARQFPLRAGFLEDPATGVAAAALGAYLIVYDRNSRTGRHEFRIAQGYAMRAPSLIDVVAECAGGMVIRTAMQGVAQLIRSEHIPFSCVEAGQQV